MSNPVGRTHTFRSQKYFSERVVMCSAAWASPSSSAVSCAICS